MTNCGKTNKLLLPAINEYLLWMIENGYSTKTQHFYKYILSKFHNHVIEKEIKWSKIFTADTLETFLEGKNANQRKYAVKSLARYLFNHGKIECPVWKRQRILPPLYEQYITYYKNVHQVHRFRIQRAQIVLTALYDYLEHNNLQIESVRIEHLDSFLARLNHGYKPATHSTHRSLLRGFLRYLYHEARVLRRNLAPLLVGAVQYAQSKPPRFLRPHELQQLFTAVKPSTSYEIRTYAMLHLAYALGLRPSEICRISLDDISFGEAEITLPQRKGHNPIKLPLPEHALKAIAAYLIGARPDTSQRVLFLRHRIPIGPLTSMAVCNAIRTWFHKAGIKASAYHLRHTYAQNLLESDATIFEIKEMLGHDNIETSRRYIHVHTKLMREVLFNETL